MSLYNLLSALFCLLDQFMLCLSSSPLLCSLPHSPLSCPMLFVCVCLSRKFEQNSGMYLFPPPPPLRSSQLFPLSSLSLPQQDSSTSLHPNPSILIPNLRSSAGDGVGTGHRQLSTLSEHPSHNAPHFPPSMLCALPPWHPGAVAGWPLIGQQLLHQRGR